MGRSIPHREWAMLAAIVLLAAALRLWGLGSKCFWVDELLAVERSRSLRQAVAYCALNHEPPLRYYLVHYLANRKPAELYVRLPSFVFGLATVPLIWLLGRRLFGARVGLVAACLLAISPSHVLHCQDARMYAVMMFFWVLSLILFFGLIEKPTQPLWWPALAIAHAVNFYISYLTIFVLAAEVVALMGWLAARKWRDGVRFSVKPYAIGAVIFAGFFGALVSFWIRPVVAVIGRYTGVAAEATEPAINAVFPTGPVGWPAEFDMNFLVGALGQLLMAGFGWELAALVGLSAGFTLCWRRNRLFVWIAALSLFIALAAILFTAMRHFVAPRYVFHLLLFFVIAFAVAIVTAVEAIMAWIGARALRAAAVGILAVVALGVAYFYVPPLLIAASAERQNWRGACGYVAENAQSNDVILTGPWGSHLAVLYYGEPALTERYPIRNCLSAERTFRELQAAPPGATVWYVTWWAFLPDDLRFLLAEKMERAAQFPGLTGTIEVWRRRPS